MGRSGANGARRKGRICANGALRGDPSQKPGLQESQDLALVQRPFMKTKKKLAYSVSGAIIIVALSLVFYSHGGEILLVPGMIAQGCLNILIILLFDDLYRIMHLAPAFTACIYAILIFVALTIISGDKHTRT
jgi:hypothetical protein